MFNQKDMGTAALKFIRQEGSKWCVFARSGKKLGCHDKKEDAQAQLAAIEANKSITTKGPACVTQLQREGHTLARSHNACYKDEIERGEMEAIEEGEEDE